MRELIIGRIKNEGWLDYFYRRLAPNFSYEKWLESLSDEDLLDSYNRVRDRENNLD